MDASYGIKSKILIDFQYRCCEEPFCDEANQSLTFLLLEQHNSLAEKTRIKATPEQNENRILFRGTIPL
jgi:hypothetical protein